MTAARRNALLLLCLLLAASLACNLSPEEPEEQVRPTSVPAATPVPAAPTATPAPAVPAGECRWVLTETTEALTGAGPNTTVEQIEWGLTTSTTIPATGDCPEQVFKTTHDWNGLEDELMSDWVLPLRVDAEYALWGSPECAAEVPAAITTYLTVGDQTIQATFEEIELLYVDEDNEEYGYGDWTVPLGRVGDSLTVEGIGAAGTLGGSVIYTYVCQPMP